jgi:hypothetical protein
MVKKVYSAPVVVSENVELGVFGSYGQSGPKGGIKFPIKIRGKSRGWWW